MSYIVITGAGSGIGEATSMHLKSKGLNPILFGRTESKLITLSEKLDSAPYLSVDLSKESSKQKVIEYLAPYRDQLIGLVNNAGVFKPSSFQDSDSQNWSFHLENNLLSSVNMIQAFLESLDLKKKKPCSIVNVASTLGHRPIPNTSAYSASKAALLSLTQSLAIEYAPYNVRVNAVSPGIVDTPIHKPDDREEWKSESSKLQPLGRIGDPKDIAGLISHFITQESSWTTGVSVPVDGGILLNS